MAITQAKNVSTDAPPSTTTKIAFCVPVLPGMEAEHRVDMAAAEGGDKEDLHTASRRRAGIRVEKAWHQGTPDGTLGIVYIEADDLDEAFRSLATSDDPYDAWFRDHAKRINGVDLSKGFALPELMLDWVSPSVVGATVQMMAYASPILPGKEGTERSYHASVAGGLRTDEHRASRTAAGVTREAAWLQDTPMGPVAVGVMEAEDLETAIRFLATSDLPFDQYFRDTVREVHGIDFEDGFPPPELILDWSA
ncbi:MAG: hypothetical protein HKN93_01660 [Acidimicrobiia bacterium]|nr:hypothetical protein [Acidimicrobiia bacterium]